MRSIFRSCTWMPWKLVVSVVFSAITTDEQHVIAIIIIANFNNFFIVVLLRINKLD